MRQISERSCLARLLTLAIAISGAEAASAQAQPAPGALVERSFCKPVFTVDGVARPSGTAFLMERLAGRRTTFLVTAQHLFSSPASELPRHVSSAQCRPPGGTTTFRTGPAIAIPGAHPLGAPSDFKDIAVFPVLGHSPGLPLATLDVGPGALVWLLASPASGRERGSLLHRARVVASEGFLAYRFDDQSLGPDQTSGAAVINVAGEVVGLNIGYTRVQGELIGVGDRLATLQAVLKGLP